MGPVHTIVSLLLGSTLLEPPIPPAPSPSAIGGLVAELLLIPETLAVAGLSAGQATQAMALLVESPAEASIAAARGSLASAVAVLEEADMALLAHPGNPSLFAARSAAAQAVASASSQLDQARDTARAAALASAGEPVLILVERYIENAQRRVPPQFRVLELEPAQWVEIEVALRAEARALRSEQELATPQATLLASIRSHPDVVAALANLNSSLQALEQALPSP